MSEIAFVVPSAEMYNRWLADPHGGLKFYYDHMLGFRKNYRLSKGTCKTSQRR